jgi:isoprenylcysteine carboxyl methyltransferase (ICMT) family protein YpbQ
MLPYQCSLLLYTELHQGVQRVLQIRGFLLLQQEIKMLIIVICSLGAGWQEKFPLR